MAIHGAPIRPAEPEGFDTMTAPTSPDKAQPDDRFETMASAYARWAHPISARFTEVALRRVGLTSGMRVLDVGAGTGSLAVPASALGCAVTAIDRAPAMVQRLRERLAPFAQSHAELMDMRALAFEPASFDATFSIFCAAFADDAEAIFAQMTRLTKPGGAVGIVNWTTEFGGPMFEVLARALEALPASKGLATSPGVHRLLTARELEQALRGAGCSEVRVEAVEVGCPLPEPARFLEELESVFQVVPAYAQLTPAEKPRLQELVAQAFQSVPVVDGVYTYPAVAHLAVGTAH